MTKPQSAGASAPGNRDDDLPKSVPVRRAPLLLEPDGERILFKPYVPGDDAACRDIVQKVLRLPEKQAEHDLRKGTHSWCRADEDSVRHIRFFAQSNYRVRFSDSIPLSQRVIHPTIAAARQGFEDARFVSFQEEDGSHRYYATYTAWDGQLTFPQLLETRDFVRFRMRTLRGPAARNKGLALFPRRIDGKYAMISRVDNRSLFLMFSNEVDSWREAKPLAQSQYDWEYVKIGNCGSPIETDAGWLLLTHGVRAMRRYCIGAMLLDLEDPSKVIGRLAEPFLQPDPQAHRGYVPDVVYSCGAMLHQGNLVLPYAVSDEATTVATIRLSDLLSALKSR